MAKKSFELKMMVPEDDKKKFGMEIIIDSMFGVI